MTFSWLDSKVGWVQTCRIKSPLNMHFGVQEYKKGCWNKTFSLLLKNQLLQNVIPVFPLRLWQTLGSYSTRKNFIQTLDCKIQGPASLYSWGHLGNLQVQPSCSIQSPASMQFSSLLQRNSAMDECLPFHKSNTWLLNNANRTVTFLIPFTYPSKIPFLCKGLCSMYQHQMHQWRLHS